MVIFHEKDHRYENTEFPELEYISSTTLVGLHKPKFEAYKIAGFVAKKRGITREEVLAEWDATRDFACEKGTLIHKFMEDHINGLPEPDNKFVKGLIKSYDDFVEEKIKPTKTNAEVLVHDELNEYIGIAGLVDIIWEFDDDTFMIGDYKTNKQFKFYDPYRAKLKPPVEHLQNCEYDIYSLQLSLYALLNEKETGKKWKGSYILFLSGNEWKPIEVKDLRKEMKDVVNRYYETSLEDLKNKI